MKTLNLDDLIDVYSLRSELVNLTSKELEEEYSDTESFLNALYTTKDLLDIDNCAFAIFSEEITNKIYKLINIKRFEIKKEYPEEYRLINTLIEKLNAASRINTEDLDNQRLDYFETESINRGLIFKDYDSLLFSLGVDIFIIDYLDGQDIPIEIEPEYLLGSMLSLINNAPILFSSEENKKSIEELLNQIKEQSKHKLAPEILKQKVLKS